MERRLQEWGAQLDGLAAKSNRVGTEMKADEQALIAELQAKRYSAQGRLAELKFAGSDRWDAVKTGVENAYGEIEAGFKKMRR